jgi:eukaryotic-like serine/threonine-protein kinase
MADDSRGGTSATATARRFAAFISYSHNDEEFGDWLHKRLERYEVPSALVGRDGPVGPIGKRLGKVFRDRADLSAAHDLGGEIRAGLEQSDALIVLCSPRSAGSKYVHEEVRTFK